MFLFASFVVRKSEDKISSFSFYGSSRVSVFIVFIVSLISSTKFFSPYPYFFAEEYYF